MIVLLSVDSRFANQKPLAACTNPSSYDITRVLLSRGCMDAVSAAGSTPSDSSHVGRGHRLSHSSRLRDHLSAREAHTGNAGKLLSAGRNDDDAGT